MIRFILIENDKQYITKYKNIIDKIMFNNSKNYEIKTFNELDNNLKNIIQDNSITKIYILDIELKGKYSGLDIVKLIRENDWESEIIFTTIHDKMFETVYRSNLKVYDFIEKFYNLDKRLEQDIIKIISQKYDDNKFLYIDRKSDLQIYLKDILYMYRDTQDRKIVILTNKNKFLANLTIKEALQKCDNRFRQIHRACIVNTNEVNLYNWSEGYFILKTGEKINLCSKFYKNKN